MLFKRAKTYDYDGYFSSTLGRGAYVVSKASALGQKRLITKPLLVRGKITQKLWSPLGFFVLTHFATCTSFGRWDRRPKTLLEIAERQDAGVPQLASRTFFSTKM